MGTPVTPPAHRTRGARAERCLPLRSLSKAFPGVRFSWPNVGNHWIVFTSFFVSNRQQWWAATPSACVKNPSSASPERNTGSADGNGLGRSWGCHPGLPPLPATAESLTVIRARVPRLSFCCLPGKREDRLRALLQAFTLCASSRCDTRQRERGARCSQRLRELVGDEDMGPACKQLTAWQTARPTSGGSKGHAPACGRRGNRGSHSKLRAGTPLSPFPLGSTEKAGGTGPSAADLAGATVPISRPRFYLNNEH